MTVRAAFYAKEVKEISWYLNDSCAALGFKLSYMSIINAIMGNSVTPDPEAAWNDGVKKQLKRFDAIDRKYRRLSKQHRRMLDALHNNQYRYPPRGSDNIWEEGRARALQFVRPYSRGSN